MYGSIEVNENLTDPMPMTLVLENLAGETCEALIIIETDAIYEYQTVATYQDGELLCSFTAEDGTIFSFNYYLYNKSTLNGEFTINYGGANDSIEGISELEK